MSVFKEKWGDKMVHVKLKAFLLRTEEWVRQWHGKVAFEEKKARINIRYQENKGYTQGIS